MKFTTFHTIAALLLVTNILHAAPLELLTEAEAEKKPETKSHLPLSSNSSHLVAMPPPAPQIKIEEPDSTGLISKPFAIKITFQPTAGAAIDFQTLKVEAIKFMTFDITDRIRPYFTSDGIYCPEANVPSGNVTIRLSVSDTQGHKQIAERKLDVQ